MSMQAPSWSDPYEDRSNSFRKDGPVLCKIHKPEFRYNEQKGYAFYQIAIEAIDGPDTGKIVYKNIKYQGEWGPKEIGDIFAAIYGAVQFNEMKKQYWPTPGHMGKALEFLQAKLNGAVFEINQVTGKNGFVNHYFKELKESPAVEPSQFQAAPPLQPATPTAAPTGSVTFADDVTNNPSVF